MSLYAFLSSVVSAILNRIHSHEDVGAPSTLAREPSLKIGARYSLGLGNSLERLACGAIAHKDRDVVCGLEQLPNVLRSGERSRPECNVGAHG